MVESDNALILQFDTRRQEATGFKIDPAAFEITSLDHPRQDLFEQGPGLLTDIWGDLARKKLTVRE